MNDVLEQIRWNEHGLVAAIAQDYSSKEVLMQAWMNQAALEQTIASGTAVYWSRSRQQLWVKGEQSGHTQIVHSLRLDCDGDAILLSVEQLGGIACHTGRRNCFYRVYNQGAWQIDAEVIREPGEIYKK